MKIIYLTTIPLLFNFQYFKFIILSSLIKCISITTDQQALIFNKIIQVVNKAEGDMFFLYRYEGTGKTFIWKKLASSLRADKKNVLMVASRGIAFLLLPGG